MQGSKRTKKLSANSVFQRRILLCLLVLIASRTGAASEQTPILHTFADWKLPACQLCDRAIIEQNLPRRDDQWPAVFADPLSAPPRAPKLRLWARRQAQPPEGQTEANDRKTKRQQSSPPPTSTSPGHIFWVIPAYKVDYGKGFVPLTPKEKFEEWAQASYDPLGLAAGAVEAATLEHSSQDGFCGYGHGFTGYGKCFGSLELDATDSSFIGDFLLPVLWHQDPRYFRLGEGSFGRRLWYAVSHVFVTYNDAGHTVFYTSALSGTAIGAALSNLYYPPQDVGLGHTMSRVAIDLGNTALYNLAAEFWPDIKRSLPKPLGTR